MKLLSAELQAHLDSGATTLCWCWRLTRRDGIVLGFTDHDRDLMFDGTTFEAAAGFSASEIKEAVGLGIDNLDVEGALQSGRLDEAQLASGLFDDAPSRSGASTGPTPARADALGQPRRSAPRRVRLHGRGARAGALSAAAPGPAVPVRLRCRSRRRALQHRDGLAGVPWTRHGQAERGPA
jgi:hypothetical protein